MSLNKQELFVKLLEQLNLANNDHTVYQAAQIDSVVVHEISEVWEFNFATQSLWSLPVLTQFVANLQTAFNNIAKVKWNFKLANAVQPAHEAVWTYWPFVVQFAELSGGMQQMIVAATTVDQGRKLQLKVQNQIAANYFHQTGLAAISDAYRRLGITDVTFEVLVDAELNETTTQQLREAQMLKEREIAQQAQAKMQAASQNGDAKLALGRRIADDAEITRMIDINQEERSVVIEGYIFDSEVRVLRSERQLLSLKVTDYSSSYLAKNSHVMMTIRNF